MSVHEDTLQGLKEALEYVRGDSTKARSMVVSLPEETGDTNQLLFKKIASLSESNRQRAIEYVDELLQASNG